MPGLTVHELVDLRPLARMFISYARQDEELLNELSPHLAVLIREAIVKTWSAKQIEPGQQWQGETANNLEAAHIIVLLISADYLASDFTYSIEMKRALDRQREGRAVVIPVILSPCAWQRTPLRQIQVLPRDGMPITEHDNRDQAWSDLTREIEQLARDLNRQPPGSSGKAGSA